MIWALGVARKQSGAKKGMAKNAAEARRRGVLQYTRKEGLAADAMF